MAWRAGAAEATREVSETRVVSGRLSMFRALEYRNFRYYWLGQVAAVASQTMEHIALAWLVLELTNSPLLLGITGLVQAVPSLALAIVGGAVADRFDRRQLMVLTTGLTMILFFGLGGLVVMGVAEVWHVMAFAFLLGLTRVLEQPARHGLLPHLVPREEMADAIALSSIAWQLPRPVGPALAGVLIAVTGIGPTFLIAGGCCLAATVCYALVDVRRPPPSDHSQGIMRDMVEGLDFVRRNQIFYGLMGMAFFDSLFGLSYTVMLPVIARDVLHVGSEGYGLLQTAGGIGGLAGTLVAAGLAHARHKGLQAIIGGVAFGLLLVALAASPWYGLSLGLLFLLGLANQTYMTAITTVLQLNLPDELRGRVMSIWGLNFRFIPLGGTIAGAVAQLGGAPLAVGMGGVMVVGMGVLVAAALPQVRRTD